MDTIQEIAGARIRELREAKGWKQDDLAEKAGLHPTYIGSIERGEKNATVESYQKVALAFGIHLSELFKDKIHKLEKLFNAPASDIMEAIYNGFRAQVDVKGKLAELYLSKYLKELTNKQQIERYIWSDKDGEPDFIVYYKGHKIITECKNLRSGEDGLYKKNPAYKVELQKTRNSKDGSNTRSYPVDYFDILAVCLFNQIGKWSFYYIATKYLERDVKSSDFLKIFQRVPLKLKAPWLDSILDVIKDITGEIEIDYSNKKTPQQIPFL